MFVRQKGKSFYLVHNVREGVSVRQIHLACLGRFPHLPDDLLAQVARDYPAVAAAPGWQAALREQTLRRFPADVFQLRESADDLLAQIERASLAELAPPEAAPASVNGALRRTLLSLGEHIAAMQGGAHA